MRKILCFIAIALMGVAAFAQTVTLTFTGRDAAEHWIQLNRVAITNLTKSWQETIYWPDTTLTMQNGTGINESVANGGFALSQNNPNPFTGTTDVNLTAADPGAVTLKIVDGNGKIVETHHGTSLQPGTHQFRVSLSAVGTYVMTARQNGKSSSIKMVCNGGGNTNGIDYLGMVQTITYVLKSTTTNPFNFGDQMEYVGYATINGTEVESQRITQAQGTSQIFTLIFDEIQHQLPIVTTSEVSNVTGNTATCGGDVTFDDGATITARGVCWSINHNPTISDSHTTDGSGMGSFTSDITGLTAGITYYVRAYATNCAGTAYGNEVSFTTTPLICGVSTLTDVDGNVYNTIQIGDQCWMKENLRTTRYANGTSIALGNSTSTSTAYRYCPQGNPSNVSTYGYLYNWKAVMGNSSSSNANPSGVQGICPTGWHVPSNAEWAQLTDYVSSQSQYVCGGDNTHIAKALASTTGWQNSYETCAVGNNPSDNNATGFCALPAGVVSYISGTDSSWRAGFWGSTFIGYSFGVATAASVVLLYDEPNIWNNNSTYWGYSVRCVCDNCSSSPLPTVTTSSASNVTATSATCGGNVTSDGGVTVTARGVCWSTNHNTTVNGSHTTDGSGTGSFTSSLTGLTAGTTYYMRAYATNSVGTSYGEEVSFTTTPQLPTVTTYTASNIAMFYATSGGNVTSNGGATITARGVCWSTSQNPTISDSHTTDGSGMGSFTSSLTGLIAGTTYYVRAYATNSMGTAYGNEVSFTTNSSTAQDGQPCPGTPTLTDIDGNAYNTVWIGQQCWMKENLRTTRYANGICIALATTITGSTTTAYRYDYNTYDLSGVPTEVSTYGYLYNWKAVMGNSSSSSANPSGVQGICPTGWHVPSDAEWTQLTDYVSSQSRYVCGDDNTQIAKALASNSHWREISELGTCTVGSPQQTYPYDLGNNNATGFSALPAGYFCSGGGQGCNYHSQVARFWSATKPVGSIAARHLDYNTAIVTRLELNGESSPFWGCSVRCLRNESGSSTPQSPIVYTSTASNITGTTVTCGGNVTSNGGSPVTAYGVCWSTSHNPTVNNSHTTDGSGMGSFTSNVTGLTANTTYYVRAYATNNIDTAYGNEVSFTAHNCGTSTLTDIDGNTYNTVQIGNQCWMKENLRTTRYANGTNITLVSSGNGSSNTIAFRYYPYGTSSNVSTYGYLYNWGAVKGPFSNNQGVCPNGWHVPSDAEWTQLTDYVSSQSQYVCGGDNTYIANALASTTGWNSCSSTCMPGNTPSSNNATGFSALPAGGYNGSYDNIGYAAIFWSSTENNNDYAKYRQINNCLSVVLGDGLNSKPKSNGYSVRCARD